MHPILVDWGPLVIPTWHVFFVIGAIASYFLLVYLSRGHPKTCRDPSAPPQDDENPRHSERSEESRSTFSDFGMVSRNISPPLEKKFVSYLFMGGYISSYFGARLLSIIIEEDVSSVNEFISALFNFGAMTFYGGLIGCTLFILIFSFLRKQNIAQVADCCVTSGFLGLSIGRIGCFLNGDDYGLPIPLDIFTSIPWWAVSFPNLSDGVYRYPVQLLETFLVGGAVFITVYFFKNIASRFQSGFIALTMLSYYAILRFFLEYLRGDERGWVIEQVLSPSQFISIIVLLVVGAIVLVRLRIRSS